MDNILFEKIVNSMKAKNLNMESLIITENNNTYSHFFVSEKTINIHSISKTITSMLLGIAIEKGYFKDGLNTFIMQYLQDIEINNKENLKYLNEVQLKHLVTLSMGYDEQILNEKHIATLEDDRNLIKFALNYPIRYEAGTHFCYCNAPIYLLSAIIEKETKIKLSDFAKTEIMDKLKISNFNWIESKENYAMGCTGIEILPKDLHKIGIMIINNGMYEGKQIIPINYLKEMINPQILTPNNYNETRALPKYAYGYNLWICKNGIYYHDGSNGQYLIIVPNNNIVITTTASQNDMKPITECMREIFEEG